METIQAIGLVVMGIAAIVVLLIGIRSQWRHFRHLKRLLKRESELGWG